MPWRHPRKTPFALALCGLALCLVATSAFAQAPPPPPPPLAVAPAGPGVFKDLQVLPKDTTKAQIKAIMKEQSKALGVDCDHCHKEPDMAADTPKKTIAREMMKMTAELNKKYRSTTNGKVTCWSCHRGAMRPAEAGK
jgi:hypothetical protein